MRATFFQRHFEFFDEQAFAADLRERFVKDLIAACGHAQEAHGEPGNYTLKLGFHVMGLRKRQRTFTGGNNQGFAHAVCS